MSTFSKKNWNSYIISFIFEKQYYGENFTVVGFFCIFKLFTWCALVFWASLNISLLIEKTKNVDCLITKNMQFLHISSILSALVDTQ